MSDGPTELPRSNLVETNSPSVLYNLAVCEAFQQSARKTILPEGFQDTERELVILGGSFGKGLGTRFSDLDIIDFTDSHRKDLKWVEGFIEGMEEEFNNLVSSDPRFAAVQKYSHLSEIIGERNNERIRRTSAEERYTTIIRLGDRQRAVAERAARMINPTDTNTATLPSRINFEFESTTVDDIINQLYEPTSDQNLEVMLLLTSVPGINAYELTPGNLRFHQERLIKVLRLLHDTNPKGYKTLEQILQESWKKYKYSVKSITLVKQLQRTEDKVFKFSDFFKFDHFPTIDELEEFFRVSKKV